jgi:membrane fusion protein, adhesin transport system
MNESQYNYDSFRKLESSSEPKKLATFVVLLFMSILAFISLVHWTQNVNGNGYLTTLRPEQQPHAINSYITGKIQKWYVIDGQHIKKGDTIAFMLEVKTEYLSPNLKKNLEDQLGSKSMSMNSYPEKIKYLDQNISSLQAEYDLKVTQYKNKVVQYRNKVSSDSAGLEAAKLNSKIEKIRFNRVDSLYTLQIKSRKEWEEAQLKYNKAQNDLIFYQNKFEISRNEYFNTKLESSNYINEFLAKLSKAQSDRQSAISEMGISQKEYSEMENKLESVKLRNSNHYIIAPHDAYVLKTNKKGIGEIVKEGDPVVSLIPIEQDLAVELYVRPVDLPLINIGERIRLIFDGWPSLVFGGWPNASFGSFGGEVYAIDRNISTNGLYRVLIIPDEKDPAKWPSKYLKLGSGVKGIFLLNSVPIWYEMWRQINGFPPEFYDGKKSDYKLDESIDEKYHTK